MLNVPTMWVQLPGPGYDIHLYVCVYIYIYIYVWHEDEKPGRREEKAYGVGPAAPARPP